MNRVVVLDTNVLGLLVHPRDTAASVSCRKWLADLLADGDTVALPEIADYEVRRELMLRQSVNGLGRLDALHQQATYVPITTAAMRQAAVFWAQVRALGSPTADRHALDGDVILAAQASFLAGEDETVLIATTNVKHLALFADARRWQDI